VENHPKLLRDLLCILGYSVNSCITGILDILLTWSTNVLNMLLSRMFMAA